MQALKKLFSVLFEMLFSLLLVFWLNWILRLYRPSLMAVHLNTKDAGARKTLQIVTEHNN